MRLERRAAAVIAAAAILVMARGAEAGEPVPLGDGSEVVLEGGRAKLLEGGREVWSGSLGEGAPKVSPKISTEEISGGVTAVVAAYAEGGKSSWKAVLVRADGERRMKVAWSGSTAMSGDPGERSGWEVKLEDLTGDGLPEVIVGRIFEPVGLCGVEDRPLLFRKVWDPGSGKLRPVLARRPGLEPIADIAGAASAAGGEPLIRTAVPASVSRSAGDGEATYMLSPPSALVDGDEATAWVTPPGNGAGEFATFSVRSAGYGITRLGIRAMPDDAKRRSYDNPKTVVAAAAGAAYRLVFPDGYDAGSTIWFDLPKPLRTGCLSIVLESSARPSPKRPMALAELTVLTEIDREGGLEILARDLGDPERGEQAVAVLRTIGKRAVEPIRETWEDLDGKGKRRATRVVAEAAPRAAADLLALAAVDGDEVMTKAALAGLEKCGDDGARKLLAYVDSKLETRTGAAIAALAVLSSPVAFEGLLALLGSDDAGKVAAARSAVPEAVGVDEDRQEQLWRAISRERDRGGERKLLELMRAGAPFKLIGDRVATLAATMYREAEGFERKYRLTRILASSPSPEAIDVLLEGSKDGDREIRALAVEGLGNHGGREAARSAIADALEDNEIRVRLAAMESVRRVGLEGEVSATLASLARKEPWPALRIEVIRSAGALCETESTEILEAAIGDPVKSVRLEALKAAATAPAGTLDPLVEGRLADPEEKNEVLAAAAMAAGARCQKTAVPLLGPLLKRGAEPLADGGEIDAAVAAAAALGQIGGDEAREILERARKRSNPYTDRAIDAALKHVSILCGRAAPEKKDDAEKPVQTPR